MTTTRRWCTNVDERGRECDSLVARDAPVSLCAGHMRHAFLYFLDRALADRDEQAPPDERLELARQLYETAAGKPEADLAAFRAIREPYVQASKEWAAYEHLASVVYYLRFGDRIKIGTSKNLKARLTSVPYDELIAVEVGGQMLENMRHQQFQAHHITGEWFAPDEEILRHCATIRELQPDVQVEVVKPKRRMTRRSLPHHQETA